MVLVILAADATYTFIRSGSLLSDARDSFERAAAALADSDLSEAQEHLEQGLERADGAADLTSHPGFAVVRFSPLGDDARAIDVIADALRLTARAGLIAIEGGQAMADGEGIAPSILRDGRVEFDLLQQGQPYLERAAGLLSEAASQFDVELHPRMGALDRALASTDLRVEGAEESVDRLVALVGSLPTLLAEGGSRHYLLAFQAPGEARGTGGVIGLLGVLRAKDGRLTLSDVRSYSDIQPRPIEAVNGPEWFEKRYAPFFGLRQWPQVNLSPHFPTVSKILLRMYREATGRSLDGVIAMDPIALESMMSAVEPIRQEGFAEPLTEKNIAEVLMEDAYTRFPTPDGQNAFLEGVVRQFWSAVSQGAFDSLSMVKGLGEAAATQHLKMFSTNAQGQQSLRALRADGDFTHTGRNLQMVWHNNVAVNKVDFFVRRTILTSISLASDGMATVHTEISIRNTAPAGTASLLLGPGIKGDPPGLNRMYLNILVPKGSDMDSFSVNGNRKEPFRAFEAGFPVIWDILEIPRGESSTVEIDYRIPRSIEVSPMGNSFEFVALPQPLAHRERYEIRVEIDPSLLESLEVRDGILLDRSTVVSKGFSSAPRHVGFVLNE